MVQAEQLQLLLDEQLAQALHSDPEPSVIDLTSDRVQAGGRTERQLCNGRSPDAAACAIFDVDVDLLYPAQRPPKRRRQDSQLAQQTEQQQPREADHQRSPREEELHRTNASLLSQLEEASRVAQQQPCRDIPGHWTARTLGQQNADIQLVELPLPGYSDFPELPLTVNSSAWMEVVEQGVSPASAVAALMACNGDSDSALVWATCNQSHESRAGGSCYKGTKTEQSLLEAWARIAEAQRVLQRFAKHGMRQDQVCCIERVENKMLWHRYALRSQELCKKLGYQGHNESLLFHGANKETLTAIINEGFDIRVAGAGALGTGTYFAKDAIYSTGFCSATRRAQLTQAEVGHLEQHHADGSYIRPSFEHNAHAMLLCRVALGKSAVGAESLRRPPTGHDSVCRVLDRQRNDVFAVFDNNQSYPEYIVHFVP